MANREELRFKVNDKVMDKERGVGKVVSTNVSNTYPICVKFGENLYHTFTENGQINELENTVLVKMKK